MRLAEMVLRENFYQILQNTVEDYFCRVHGKNVSFTYKKTDATEKMIVNGKLGFIVRFPAPSGLRKFLLSEYNVRGSKLKYIAGKAVALAVGTLPQIGKLRNAYITKGALDKDIFISPQNRSVRFFNYKAMTVDCIIKSGFTDKYFNNQLDFREKYQYDFMLPLLDSGDGWFREPILMGHPLARVTDEVVYQKGTCDALSYIGRLAAETLTYEKMRAYIGSLEEKIYRLLVQAHARKHIASLEITKRIVDLAIHWSSAAPEQIPLCMSHGDFQGGNIWVDVKGKTWIYDWETVGQRSIWYDSAVLNYSLRRNYGWKNLLEDTEPKAVLSCDLEKERSLESYQGIKGILVLEDILFYLEDMLELPENWGAELYDAFILRMKNLLFS